MPSITKQAKSANKKQTNTASASSKNSSAFRKNKGTTSKQLPSIDIPVKPNSNQQASTKTTTDEELKLPIIETVQTSSPNHAEDDLKEDSILREDEGEEPDEANNTTLPKEGDTVDDVTTIQNAGNASTEMNDPASEGSGIAEDSMNQIETIEKEEIGETRVEIE